MSPTANFVNFADSLFELQLLVNMEQRKKNAALGGSTDDPGDPVKAA